MLRNSTPYRARKKKGRARKIGLVSTATFCSLLGLAVVAYILIEVLSTSSFCMITEIEVVGAERIARNEIVELCNLGLQANLLAVSADRIRRQVEGHPWIERAEIKRKWPNCLFVQVKERQAVAIANVEGALFYVDAKGRIFTGLNAQADYDYPVISGLGRADIDCVDPSCVLSHAMQFLRYVRKNDSVLPRQNISEIHIRREGDLVVFLADRPFPIYLGTDSMERKYYRLVKVLYWLYKKKEFEVTEYIRLDYGPDKVLVGKTG